MPIEYALRLLAIAKDLHSGAADDNDEYDRALVELCSTALGLAEEHRPVLIDLIRPYRR